MQIADTGPESPGLPPGFGLDPLGGGIDLTTGLERPQKILCADCSEACDRAELDVATAVNGTAADDAPDVYYAMHEEIAQRQRRRHRIQRDERMRSEERRAALEGR